jgi:hypothetical protein
MKWKEKTICLTGCKHDVKDRRYSIFSLTQSLAKGWQTSNNVVKIILTKKQGEEHGQIMFDTIDPGTSGVIMMVKMVPKPYGHGPVDYALDFCSLKN